jgi:sulfur carrier protein ThiS adenylyltransferase
MNKDIFIRNVPGTAEILEKVTIGIAGCGGLGSNVAVSLTRSGVGNLILADFDVVELSNINRQHFFLQDVGKKKVNALSKYLKKINPDINIKKHFSTVTPENVEKLFGKADLLIEAFDRAERKHWLIQTWCKDFPQKPVISGNGLSGYGHTDKLKVTKAGNVYFCGDCESDMTMGLCAPRVAIVANMEANVAIELLVNKALEEKNFIEDKIFSMDNEKINDILNKKTLTDDDIYITYRYITKDASSGIQLNENEIQNILKML